ncbi:MAG: hypothetical protein COV44_00145 [Deltaproteobacteria bacterium CG11_big_fil_rev_8_21_14_0_20_45_16]|nr:MAG: hypothetical protein COV44_00145 [Deltaproteobacteria bacterium CG11_big_fil_rev_8_21_14_0_20_45_16]
MKIKNTVLSALGFGMLFGSSFVAAQGGSQALAIAQNFDNGVYETQLLELQTFVNVATTYQQMENMGLVDGCAAEEVIFGMAEGIQKSQLDPILVALPNGLDQEINFYAIQVRGLVEMARDSGCVVKANDKCCKKSDDPLISDKCNAKTSKYCKLYGVRIKGCSENSDDCPSS